MASGGSFRALLGSGDQIGSRVASGTESRGAFVLKSRTVAAQAFGSTAS